MVGENYIHPSSIIGQNVKMGRGNHIGAFTIIDGNTILGDNNLIGPNVVIGCEPTDSKHIERHGDNIIIGNNNIIREFSLIEQPCYEDRTVIGNHVFVMQGVHVSHDVCISDYVVVTNMTVIAGIAKILVGANIAMGCTVNQYTTIGHYSIAATNSAVMKNIRPFSRYIPNKQTSVNYYAISKFGFDNFKEEIESYVLNNIPVHSEKLVKIVNEFEISVKKYGHKTY